MSVVCGVEIKGKIATLIILDGKRDNFSIIEAKPLKIELSDSTSQESICAFSKLATAFLSTHAVDKVIIKEGLSKGKFTSGSPVFKIEAIFQLSPVDVHLIKGPALNTFLKTVTVDLHDHRLKKYQQIAYEVAYYGLD